MGATTAEAQVDKKCYKNQTAGNQGVVKLDHLGAQIGANVVPFGTVWLTDDEAILTARAPADPADNPCEERLFMFQDANGVRSEHKMRSLILIEDDRLTPSDERYVPTAPAEPTGSELGLDAPAAAARDAQAALDSPADRPVPIAPAAPVLASSATAAVPPSHATPGPVGDSAPAAPEQDVEEDARKSWLDDSERTAEVQRGSLGGSDEAAPGSTPHDESKAGAGPPQRPAPQAPPQAPVVPLDLSTAPDGSPLAAQGAGEEVAAVTKTGEETGAAEMPAGAAPEGEFAAHEEVGSPAAPAAESTVEAKS